MRIININPLPPYPLVTGGHIRAYALLDRLRQRHDVTVLSFQRSAAEGEAVRVLAARGWNVHSVPFARFHPTRPESWPVLIRHLRARLGPQPAAVVNWDQPQMHTVLAEMTGHADVIHAEYSYLAPYLRSFWRPPGSRSKRPALITTAHDVYSITLARQADLLASCRSRTRLQRTASQFSHYEAQLGDWMDGILAMSEVDAAALRRLNPQATIKVIPNGVDTKELQPGPMNREGRHLLFLGSPLHPPNLDAAAWLLTAIWPAIYQRRPDASLTLVNMDVPTIRSLASGQPGVSITGQVSDVVPYYRHADICVTPIRAGSGTRLKILEAMALGVPVVSTPIGIEGIEASPGREAIVAEDVEVFAGAVVALLADADRRTQVVAAARRLVETHYDWDQIVARVETVYTELAGWSEDSQRTGRSPE